MQCKNSRLEGSIFKVLNIIALNIRMATRTRNLGSDFGTVEERLPPTPVICGSSAIPPLVKFSFYQLYKKKNIKEEEAGKAASLKLK